jgi:NAD(P)-dependent dehydrogenase (short-subunit alcohol dehydrogenase family)
VTRELVKTMVEASTCPGVVVNISSVSRHGNRGQSNYVATKAAIAADTVTWAREFAGYGIWAGAIAAGMIETPMTQGMHQKAAALLPRRAAASHSGAAAKALHLTARTEPDGITALSSGG